LPLHFLGDLLIGANSSAWAREGESFLSLHLSFPLENSGLAFLKASALIFPKAIFIKKELIIDLYSKKVETIKSPRLWSRGDWL
jgi:hypothetical protein